MCVFSITFWISKRSKELEFALSSWTKNQELKLGTKTFMISQVKLINQSYKLQAYVHHQTLFQFALEIFFIISSMEYERINPRNMIFEYMVPSSCWTENADSHYLLIDLPGIHKYISFFFF